MVESRNGLSANQPNRHLKEQYKTARHLVYRIRLAMEAAMEEGTLGKLEGVVEVDEIAAGGRYGKRCEREP